MKIHSSGENYLKAIYVIKMEKGMVRSVDVAEYLGVSKPSVSHAIKTLQDGGFLFMSGDRSLHLTETGQEIAKNIYEKYRYFAGHLAGMGIDPEVAEEEACRMEHTISEESFRRLKEGRQVVCPYAENCQMMAENEGGRAGS